MIKRTIICSVFSALLVLAIAAGAAKAQSVVAYDALPSSITVAAVDISTFSPTRISLIKPTGGFAGIAWYEEELFNVNAASIAFAFSSNAATTTVPIPALTCTTGGLLGSGTATAPATKTIPTGNHYLWGLSCNTGAGSQTVYVIRRGRGVK